MGYTRIQLWTLLGLQAVVSFSFECVFPFVNQMLLETGVTNDPKDVGYWSGVVESTYAVSQLIAVTLMTPVIIWSAVIVGISMISFGTSTSFAQMIVSRILGGVQGGSYPCIRMMAAEMSSKADEAHIFTLIGIAYRTGQVLGQPVGGALAHSERRFPKLFDTEFWRKYPYALPCFVGAAYALVCAFVGQLVLKETFRRKKARKADVRTPSPNSDETAFLLPAEPLGSSTLVKKAESSPSILSLLTWPLASLLVSVVAMVFITEIFFAIYPLFAFTPIELGGLGLSEAQIGLPMAARSLLCLLMMLLFSTYSDRFGRLNVYRFSIFAWIPTTLLFPVLNRIAKVGGEGGILWYAVLYMLFTFWSVTGWAWISVFLISSGLSPTPEAVATIQGMVSTAITAPQAFAPPLGTSTFALSIRHSDILGGNMFRIGTFTLSVLAFLHSLTLRDFSYDWRGEETNEAPVEEPAI
ncbi:hypothetical protein M408DRAFT_26701 [Serendipita vermifera MAFF 305830]|uniref:Major facilitator superfamily (MFS) profile domain-containing protein n=1 Tax=Serendipita vermifera MAFF 305830 TaxID=933852 RepID=A0A0C2X6J5_SERVB|nr:hypothetical protein M408DRAFT_26701 [Serendipita vermifera MAFF 305830]